MILQAWLPLGLAALVAYRVMDVVFGNIWGWILGIPLLLVLWLPAVILVGFVAGVLRVQPQDVIRAFEIGWEPGTRLFRRSGRRRPIGLSARERWEAMEPPDPVGPPRPWHLLGLDYPTSPIDNPYFEPWIETIGPGLADGEELVEFGFANEIEMLMAGPGSSTGEGFFAVTNRRSLFSYENAPREAPDRIATVEILHDQVERCEAEAAWEDPSTGRVYARSDSPNAEAVRTIEQSDMPKAAIVQLWITPEADAQRSVRFLTGFPGGQNWIALIRRFKQDPTVPEGWEPPRLF